MDKISFLLEKVSEPIVLLDFPNHRQGTKYFCGVDAVESILEYYGIDWHEMDLAKILDATPEEGTCIERIIDFIGTQGLQVEFRENMTINDLKNFLNKKIPIIMMIQAWGEKSKNYANTWEEGHYVICIGYTNNEILFADPATYYEVSFIPNNELMNRWHDMDREKKYIHFGCAVYGRKPKYDKNKWKKID
jgi:predicted double-glycine peptidase